MLLKICLCFFFRSKFFLDYVFLVFPALLVMTILSQSLLLVTSVLFACLATLLVFVICEYLMSPDRPSTKVVLNRIIDEQHQPTTFLTYFRSCMMVSVAIAILAVDFPVFPRRFAKTEKYGHSLMDLGVAGFVFASAITNRLKVGNSWEGKTIQKGWNRWIRSSYVILPLIGLARTTMLTILDYPQHVTEYGVHWNFFYTLAVIKVVSNALPKKFPLFWSCLFGTMQQTMLMQGYQMSVLTFALAGFLRVQLLSVVAWAANVPHFCVDDSPWCGVQPCLTTSINKSALAFFLLANILTGLVNLTIDTHHTDDVTSMLILISYMLTLCVVVHFRSYIKLSRKL
ncbi:hypothetical protein ANCCAN_27517 [Ancylostoma caninum]|uniref:Phosphatidylinositol-glycan biosynthesis class W protein n=1 Tax=Ancylostoma caninum TaxID=29170 RepID=A0A368F3T1_ANCCA|nr:hypothetical protein ANCCAN_27517 [Ancylostoma caninum]